MSLQEKIQQVKDILVSVSTTPFPAIGIDLDGTIDESPVFFQLLTQLWKGKVYIVTYRNDLERAKADAKRLGVIPTDVILAKSFEDKANIIKELNIKVFFDDMDEVLKHILPDVTVFKIRNAGNFNFSTRRWLYDHRTGEEV